MTDDDVRTAEDARALTRRRREARTDAVISVPFNTPHVDAACPECGEQFEVTIAGDPAEASPSFGTCPSWECDAFLKYVHDGESEPEPVGQQGLGRYA
jgi:hypothetical protein